MATKNRSTAIYGMIFGILVFLMLVLLSIQTAQANNRYPLINLVYQGGTPTADPFEIAEAGVTSNDEWTPVVHEFDGVEMVLVPVGCFQMGSTHDQIEAIVAEGGFRPLIVNEQPAHEICIEEPFWLDKFEVTQGGAARLEVSNSIGIFDGDNYPLYNINWFKARDFCELREARLPTEAEWEFAARGPDSLIFPWGNTPEPDSAVFADNSGLRSAEVGSRPDGVSWVGALDMSGNVWEWTSTLMQAYPYDAEDGREADPVSDPSVKRVMRGGGHSVPQYAVRAPTRGAALMTDSSWSLGLRCARNINPDIDLLQAESEPIDNVTEPPMITPEALEIMEASVTSNEEWTPVVREYNGVEMVLVPAGCFLMGTTDEQVDELSRISGRPDFYDDERPAHEVCIEEPFWIDRYEVTVGNFTTLGGEIGRPIPIHHNGNNLPLGLITWFEAQRFCELRGGRLPTEAEWEYAARGPDSLMYPWGNRYIQENVIDDLNPVIGTMPVGSRPGGASWVGALDMAGNVDEWTHSIYRDYPYDATDGREADAATADHEPRSARSGSWLGSGSGTRTAKRYFRDPGSASSDLGFRCVRTD